MFKQHRGAVTVQESTAGTVQPHLSRSTGLIQPQCAAVPYRIYGLSHGALHHLAVQPGHRAGGGTEAAVPC
jgi:hypothetical protein